MSRTFISVLVVAIAAVCLSASLVVADTEVLYGTIQQINQQQGAFTVQTEDQKMRSLQAPTDMLEGLEPGQMVEVELEDGKVVGIYKDE